MGTKISSFITALEKGKSFDEAVKISGVAKGTAKIQYRKWKKTQV